jgi:hypothetical protein
LEKIVPCTKYNYNDKVKEDGMSREHNMHGERGKRRRIHIRI